MKSSASGPVRLPLVVLVMAAFVLAETPMYAAPQQSSQPASNAQQTDSHTSAPTETQSSSLPNAPQSAQSSSQQPAQNAQQPPPAAPAGAAAARAGNVKGVPASEPVGAAIAPPKQHQRRSLIIKLGLAAGAAVAVGTAVALSKASPSRPPGAQASTTHP